jgi:hypothetical protein
VILRVVLDDRDVERLVRRCGVCARFGIGCGPNERGRFFPKRPAAATGIPDDDAPAVTGVVVGEIAEDQTPGGPCRPSRKSARPGRATEPADPPESAPDSRRGDDAELMAGRREAAISPAPAFRMWNSTRSPEVTQIGWPWPSCLPSLKSSSPTSWPLGPLNC